MHIAFTMEKSGWVNEGFKEKNGNQTFPFVFQEALIILKYMRPYPQTRLHTHIRYSSFFFLQVVNYAFLKDGVSI